MALRAILFHMSEAIIIRGSSNNGSSGIPVGCIVMWSGAVNNIPSGWALCNGSNGTPDLRNRFIVGAGSTYAVGNTGGSNTVTLTTSQMPAHSHTTTSDSTSKIILSSDYVTKGNSYGGWTYNDNIIKSLHLGSSSSSSLNMETWSYPGYGTKHKGYEATLSGDLTINSSGSGSAHENRPPYYALCFIMYIG